MEGLSNARTRKEWADFGPSRPSSDLFWSEILAITLRLQPLHEKKIDYLLRYPLLHARERFNSRRWESHADAESNPEEKAALQLDGKGRDGQAGGQPDAVAQGRAVGLAWPKNKSSASKPSGTPRKPKPTPSETPKVGSTVPPAPVSTPEAKAPETQAPDAASATVQESPPSPVPEATAAPAQRGLQITLIKFEPMQGDAPGGPNFRSPKLTYRITTGERIPFPAIDFAVSTSAGKLFQRHFELAAGSAFIEPGSAIDRTVSLDPTFEDNWAELYKGAEKANFIWSIEGKGNGSIEKPVHQAWP